MYRANAQTQELSKRNGSGEWLVFERERFEHELTEEAEGSPKSFRIKASLEDVFADA
jgi:hypothetical protein